MPAAAPTALTCRRPRTVRSAVSSAGDSSPERRLDRGRYLIGRSGDVPPGEVHNLEACRAQSGVPLELGHRAGRVGIFQRPVGLPHRPVSAPEKVGAADDLVPIADPRLKVGRRQAQLIEGDPRDRLQDRLRPTRLAFRIPGQPAHVVMHNSRSALDACLLRSAESATTTPARNEEARARSTTVLAAEVTGRPRRLTTCPAGRAAMCRRIPGPPVRVPERPGGRVNATVSSVLRPSRSSACTAAAL